MCACVHAHVYVCMEWCLWLDGVSLPSPVVYSLLLSRNRQSGGTGRGEEDTQQRGGINQEKNGEVVEWKGGHMSKGEGESKAFVPLSYLQGRATLESPLSELMSDLALEERTDPHNTQMGKGRKEREKEGERERET